MNRLQQATIIAIAFLMLVRSGGIDEADAANC